MYVSHKQIKSDARISNIPHSAAHEPDYWIVRWSYDDEAANAFAYQIPDHSIGILFFDGFHCMRTSDKM